MSHKKDMKRPDLIVPYADPKDKGESDMSSTMASTLPLIAMMTRNKMLGWTAVLFAVQSWLVETPKQKQKSTTPTYFSVLMALMSVVVSYMPLFFPPPQRGSATEAPAAKPVA